MDAIALDANNAECWQQQVAFADLARVYRHHGRMAEARDHLHLALGAHREAKHRQFEAGTLEALVVVCARLGEFAEALQHADRAVQLCAGRDPYQEGVLRVELAEVLAVLGRLDEALASFRLGLVLFRQTGNADGESHALAGIGDVHRRMGRYAEALESLNQAQSVATSNRQLVREGRSRLRLGELYRELGLLDDALTNL
ncbi:tetratricopeptide repeat protein [Amycolatopsis taiwanensis]|uniref:tetratricopeptide repeat protein n=1 Tax=Amycolatopsis taiwanensis TaxID=342230 RepID=UPI00146F9C2B|nr:tetratricopeptide repeat protein [Amycolatopsis taiwanensis]